MTNTPQIASIIVSGPFLRVDRDSTITTVVAKTTDGFFCVAYGATKGTAVEALVTVMRRLKHPPPGRNAEPEFNFLPNPERGTYWLPEEEIAAINDRLRNRP